MRHALEDSGLSGSVVLGPRDDHNLAFGSTLAGGDRVFDFGLFPVERASQVARGSWNGWSVLVGGAAGAIQAALPGTGIDAAIGIDGLHATLIAACVVRCLGGELQARLWPRNEEERQLIGEHATRTYGVAD